MERTVAVAQFSVDEDVGKYEAQEQALEYVNEAADDGAELIVLPEMSTQTFYPATCASESDLPDDLEPIPGPAVDNIRDVADDRSVVVVFPLLEHSEEDDYYSSAAVLDADGSLAGVYRRVHRDSSDDVHEDWLDTGDDIPVFETEVGTIGVMIGHDRHFPEQSRILGLHGAEFLCCPSAAFGGHQETWELQLRAHTVAQGVFLAAANRTGSNGDLDFYGESFIIDPRGRIQGQLGADDDLSVVDCELDEIREVRDVWQFYRDRRPETYGEMTDDVVPQGV